VVRVLWSLITCHIIRLPKPNKFLPSGKGIHCSSTDKYRSDEHLNYRMGQRCALQRRCPILAKKRTRAAVRAGKRCGGPVLAVLFVEKLTREILAPVPHRHWTFSIPRVLRGLFERERSLLGLRSRTRGRTVCRRS
jgi:hypothetical protein